MLPDDTRPLLFNNMNYDGRCFWLNLKIQIGVYAVQNEKGITHYPITMPVDQSSEYGIVEKYILSNWDCWGNIRQQMDTSDLTWLIQQLDNSEYEMKSGEYHWFSLIMCLLDFGTKITFPNITPLADNTYNITLFQDEKEEKDNERTKYSIDPDGKTPMYFSVRKTSCKEMADRLIEQILIYEDLLGTRDCSYSFKFVDFNSTSNDKQNELDESINNIIKSKLTERRILYKQSPFGKPNSWSMLIRKINLFRYDVG